MDKYATVAEFLAAQDNGKAEQINELRQIILSSEPSLAENIKWNAPNYVYDGQDRITFNVVNKEGAVKLILHMGASKKEDKKGTPLLQADEGIVEWSSDIRGIITFTSLDDIMQKRGKIEAVIQRWLAISASY